MTTTMMQYINLMRIRFNDMSKTDYRYNSCISRKLLLSESESFIENSEFQPFYFSLSDSYSHSKSRT